MFGEQVVHCLHPRHWRAGGFLQVVGTAAVGACGHRKLAPQRGPWVRDSSGEVGCQAKTLEQGRNQILEQVIWPGWHEGQGRAALFQRGTWRVLGHKT